MGRFASQVLHKLLLGFVISIVLRQFAHMPYSFLAIFPSVWRSKKKKAVGDVAAWIELDDDLGITLLRAGYIQTPCSSFIVFSTSMVLVLLTPAIDNKFLTKSFNSSRVRNCATIMASYSPVTS